ncbi:hypothetical protein BJY01DRAFT_223956 [Aspergillus pseudoustus]|uniref:Zn(2)-C6 fungal-type domain-containing protein n=1 Tax=Aspergillus pseudoustus TaxID=1810923 RepID=A0ABR4J433_9EURO
MMSSPKSSRRGMREAKRTNASCDTCKARKTKCIDPVPGPCKYCAGVSIPCTISIRRRQRPFYQVSEEEYRYGITILQKLFPTIDLNINTLRHLAHNVNNLRAPESIAALSSELPVAHLPTPYLDDGPSPVSRSQTHTLQPQEPAAGADTAVSTSPSEIPDEIPGSSDALFVEMWMQQKGCVVKDALGRPRYIGPGSDVPFMSAVRSYVQGGNLLPAPGTLRHPMRLPPPSPESRNSLSQNTSRPAHLPPLASWRPHIDRYFKVVNSAFWLISMESFCSRLDSTYASSSYQDISPSWLCFLYTILALTNQTPASSTFHASDGSEDYLATNLPTSGDPYTSNNYISLAKSLLKEVMDEANLDSIRALCAMSILLHNQGFAVASYLNVGTAVRIAYCLGLHAPQSYAEMTTIQREAAMRVACTIYELDACISRPSGRPCNIDPGSWHPSMPSEMAVSTGTYDPWGLFNQAVSFNVEDLSIHANFSRLSASADQKSILQELDRSVTALQKWHDSLPAHLHAGATMAPPHKRPVYTLHLRYWTRIISLTRLALLADIQSSAPKLRRLGQLCVEAAEHSYKILTLMHASNDLSSLTVVDTKHILDVAMISLLSLARWPSIELQQRLEHCIKFLESMDNLGLCRYGGGDLSRIVESFRTRSRAGGGGGRGVVDESSELQIHV